MNWLGPLLIYFHDCLRFGAYRTLSYFFILTAFFLGCTICFDSISLSDRQMESHPDPATAAILGIAILLLLYIRSLIRWRVRTRGLPFPPGPKQLPLIGNLFDMPKSHAWVVYRELCAQYGE